MKKRSPEQRAKISAAKIASWAAGRYDRTDFGNGRYDTVTRDRRRAFTQHRANAKLRGVEWLLTFDEWWAVWEASDKWTQRGTSAGQYCMARLGPDIGPYRAGNVFIQLSAENARDGSLGLKRTPEQNAARGEWMKGNKHRLGHTNSQRQRDAVSAKLKGRKFTAEHVAASVAAKKRNRAARKNHDGISSI